MRKGFVKTLLSVGLYCRLRKIHLQQRSLMASKHLSGGRHLHTGKQWLGFHLPVYVHLRESHQERVIEMSTFESNWPKKVFTLGWCGFWCGKKQRKLGDSSTFAKQVVTWRTLNSHDSWLHCLWSLSRLPMTLANMAGDNNSYLWTNDDILWSLPWKNTQLLCFLVWNFYLVFYYSYLRVSWCTAIYKQTCYSYLMETHFIRISLQTFKRFAVSAPFAIISNQPTYYEPVPFSSRATHCWYSLVMLRL